MAGSGKKILTYGCFGCLGLAVLLAAAGAVVFGLAWSQSEPGEIVEQSLQVELPKPDDQAAAASTEPAEQQTGVQLLAPVSAVGIIDLDLANAEFRIAPGAAGDPVRVEARYDTSSYELHQELDPEGGGEGTFRSSITFRQVGERSFFRALRAAIAGSAPRVDIWLPPDLPVELQMKIRQGGAKIDLGGLWLVAAVIDYAQGGVELVIPTPLQSPMEWLTITGSMGGAKLGDLGNASPRHLETEYKMGGVVIDLRGQWQVDSTVRIRGSMGGGQVLLPDDVTVVGVPGAKVRQAGAGELSGPTITIDASSEMGEIEFH